MAFNHQTYNAIYLENARTGKDSVNDAVKNYGVKIEPAQVAVGEKYWHVIGVHHLLPQENWSNHHVYLEALDQAGNRVRNPIGWAGWTWENRQPQEAARPVPIDKPDFEPGGNIAVGKNQIISVWMQGRGPDAGDKSDKVVKIRTSHADEPMPNGSLHNTWGHHSFYVVFQETIKQAEVQLAGSSMHGRLADGAGQTIHLILNDKLVQSATLETNDAFRFDNLLPGIYTLKVKGVAVGRNNIQLDGENTVEVNLAMPAPQESLIRGTVTNGLGHTIILGKGTTVIARQTLPPDGSFRYENLPAGVYNLAVWDTPIKISNIEVDGRNSRVFNLKIDEEMPEQDKLIDHYVLFGPPQSRGRRTNFFIAAEYLLSFSLPSGFSLQTAKLARRITIIGEGIAAGEVDALLESGSEVELIAGDSYAVETALADRIKSGNAFNN